MTNNGYKVGCLIFNKYLTKVGSSSLAQQEKNIGWNHALYISLLGMYVACTYSDSCKMISDCLKVKYQVKATMNWLLYCKYYLDTRILACSKSNDDILG